MDLGLQLSCGWDSKTLSRNYGGGTTDQQGKTTSAEVAELFGVSLALYGSLTLASKMPLAVASFATSPETVKKKNTI